MARLQRKKPAAAKRKSKPAGGTPGTADSNQATAVAKPGLLKVGGKAAKKPATASKRQAKAVRSAAAKKQPNFFDRSKQFLREVKVELKKVTWPTRQQTLGSTVVVIILVLLIAAFLGVVDTLLSSIVRGVLQ